MTPEEIKEARKKLGLNQTDFGRLIGVSLRAVQTWEKGDRNISTAAERLLKQIIAQHKNDAQGAHMVNEAISVDYREMSVMYVPLVNQYAYAGYLAGYADPEYVESLPKIPWADDIEHRGEYVCIEAKGDSMDDGTDQAIKEGDILLCRIVRKDHWRNKLHIKKWDFVIACPERGMVVKRIVAHDVDNGILTLHSLNDMYEDYTLDLREVSQIMNIVDINRKRKR